MYCLFHVIPLVVFRVLSIALLIMLPMWQDGFKLCDPDQFGDKIDIYIYIYILNPIVLSPYPALGQRSGESTLFYCFLLFNCYWLSVGSSADYEGGGAVAPEPSPTGHDSATTSD